MLHIPIFVERKTHAHGQNTPPSPPFSTRQRANKVHTYVRTQPGTQKHSPSNPTYPLPAPCVGVYSLTSKSLRCHFCRTLQALNMANNPIGQQQKMQLPWENYTEANPRRTDTEGSKRGTEDQNTKNERRCVMTKGGRLMRNGASEPKQREGKVVHCSGGPVQGAALARCLATSVSVTGGRIARDRFQD